MKKLFLLFVVAFITISSFSYAKVVLRGRQTLKCDTKTLVLESNGHIELYVDSIKRGGGSYEIQDNKQTILIYMDGEKIMGEIRINSDGSVAMVKINNNRYYRK